MNWMSDAACRRDAGTIELFHSVEDPVNGPEGGPKQRARSVALTKCIIICEGCPVRQACAEYALTGDVAGVAGGMLEDERHRLARAS